MRCDADGKIQPDQRREECDERAWNVLSLCRGKEDTLGTIYANRQRKNTTTLSVVSVDSNTGKAHHCSL